MVPFIRLRNAVAEAVSDALSITVEPRISGYLRKDDVADGKWVCLASGDSREMIARRVQKTKLTIDVAWQIALPKSTTEYPDPLLNDPWFEQQLQKVEDVKALYGPHGVLFAEQLDGFRFISMPQMLPYSPTLLAENQILTSAVRLEYVGEI